MLLYLGLVYQMQCAAISLSSTTHSYLHTAVALSINQVRADIPLCLT